MLRRRRRADKVATATNAQIQAYAVGLYASVAEPVATAQQIQTYAQHAIFRLCLDL